MKTNKLVPLILPLLIAIPASAQAANTLAEPEFIKTSSTSPINHSVRSNVGDSQGEMAGITDPEGFQTEENTTPVSATLALIAAGLFGAALLGRRPSPPRH